MGYNNHTDEAINLALQGRWEEAININREILEVSPDDIGALNRMGKALAEVGRNSEARTSYERVLVIDPHNTIAQKNLKRLANLKDEKRPAKESRVMDSRFFIEETSKARIVSLYLLGTRQTLEEMSAGDQVSLKVNGQKLIIVDASDNYIGEVEPKIATRLVKLINGGNEYKAAIISIQDKEVKIIIRETYQHPSQHEFPSFPPPKIKEEIKPYLKNTIVKRGLETSDTIEDESEESDDWVEDDEEFEENDYSSEDEISALAK